FLVLLSELEPGDLPEVRTPEDWVRACQKMATLVSNRVLSSLAAPFSVKNQKLHVTASVGASISSDAESPEQFLEHAEAAMTRAKELGRNQLHFYTADLQQSRQRKLSLDGQLRQALENDELLLLYQPIVHLSSGRLAGAEALLRWKHPEMDRLLLPADFLSVAEETGLIVPIGYWVLMEACRQAAAWRDAGLEIFTAVNLSTRQLMQADLPKSFLRAIEVSNLDPRLLVVDINEGSNLVDPERTDATVEELSRYGVAIAIDDFGVGFSSLKRLTQVKMLKFDRTLVQDVPASKQGSSVCVAVLGICSSLGVRSVAEGVEQAEQATFFLDKGCELAQGFYFSEPVRAEEITAMWEDNRTWSGF
ncbi:MAG: GGDEF domain-containing phosphodiesterase, partial [Candidatus Eremiobacterota bacterium]